jgi:hypothetical protein
MEAVPDAALAVAAAPRLVAAGACCSGVFAADPVPWAAPLIAGACPVMPGTTACPPVDAAAEAVLGVVV